MEVKYHCDIIAVWFSEQVTKLLLVAVSRQSILANVVSWLSRYSFVVGLF